MNWKITLLEVAELGLVIMVLWLPFRMGQCGVRNLWSILVGWFALAGLVLSLVMLSMLGVNGIDSELVNAMPEGPIALFFILLGWIPAWGLANAGRSRRYK